MMAALEAARCGAKVAILEKEKRIGKKLLATGNGRCNFSNIDPDLRYYHGEDLRLAESVLKQISAEEVLRIFHQLGITHKIEEAGKVYPYSDQGSAVLDVLRYEIEMQNINILTETKAVSIHKKKDYFMIKTNKDELIEAKKVILATGGKAGSQFGADGSGYQLAQSLGHRLVDPFPAIVQLKLHAPWLKAVNGVKWQGQVCYNRNGKCLRTEKGEILFTEYGISGPPVLQLGRLASRQHKNDTVKIDLFPTWGMEQIQAEVYTRLQSNPQKPADFSLVGLLHKKMIPVLLKEAGVDKVGKPSSEITEKEIKNLIYLLKEWEIGVSGTLSWQHAQVTAGGIDTREIHSSGLESQLISGLYLTGEVLDTDGDCGGYNLHWAWCTGLLAGRQAASFL